MPPYQNVIDEAFEQRAALTPANAPPDLKAAVQACIADLDAGRRRVAGELSSEYVAFCLVPQHCPVVR